MCGRNTTPILYYVMIVTFLSNGEEPQVSCETDSDCAGDGEFCDLSQGSTKNHCVYGLPPVCDVGTIYNAQKGKCEIECIADRRMLAEDQLFRPPAPH